MLEPTRAMDDTSSVSSDSSDGSPEAGGGRQDTTAPAAKEEELVTRLQLRLSASHLPKIGGKRVAFAKRSPSTFATVASIVKRRSNDGNRFRASCNAFLHADPAPPGQSFGSASLSNLPGLDDDFMVEWGSTEIVSSARSPNWIKTIPLKYEYGSELFFYVRIIQAESEAKEKKNPRNNGSPKTSARSQSLSPQQQHYQQQQNSNASSDDGSVESISNASIDCNSPEKRRKNKGGYCFGTALFEVGDLLGSRNYTKVKRLKKGGCVYARVEPVDEKDDEKLRFRFQFQAHDLVAVRNKMGQRLGLTKELNTVLEIARPHESPVLHSWVTVFRSRPILNSASPRWDLSELDLESLCRNDDLSQTIRLSVFRVRKTHKQKLIGMCETTMHNIINMVCEDAEAGNDALASEKCFYLQRSIHKLQQVGQLRVKIASIVTLSGRQLQEGPLSPLSPSSSAGGGSIAPTSVASLERTESHDTTTTATAYDPFNVDLKQLSVRSTSVQYPSAVPQVTLTDFLDKGGQLDFCAAIDFTSSNGNPLKPGTLHFQGDDVFNDYEESITAIGNAIDKYNTSSEYVVWGFGAKFHDGVVRHLFQCGPNPTVQGVDGILEAYKSVFRSGGIYMSGPTVFVKAIQAAAIKARNYKMAGSKRYCVLLIVTDGIMDNFEETREKLAVYGEVPLSVIFVGVGRADFRMMHALCGTPTSASQRKNTAFVEFRQHQHDPRSLAQTALQELPKQLSDYLLYNSINL